MKLPLSFGAVFLLLLATGLSGALAYELIAPYESFDLPHVPAHKAVAVEPATNFVAPPLANFSNIDEHSIFNPTRKEFRIPERAQERPHPAPPSAILVGVILADKQRIAITKKPGVLSALNVLPGQMLDGWKVAAIEADHVDLTADGGDTYQIKLQARPSVQPNAPLVPAQPVGVPPGFAGPPPR